MTPTASTTRWSPTPEQLMILEELYRSGIRTPSASQIQHITTHLSLYGKIEGKNVFYWFQNHKARDRQKLRRKLLKQQQQQQQQQTHHHLLHQIESPSAAALPQLPPLYNQTQFLPRKMLESSTRMEMEKPNTMCSQDRMMMLSMMMDTSTPCCNNTPKTLQLFPITTKALKDECITSHHHFSPAQLSPPPCSPSYTLVTTHNNNTA